MRWNQSCAVQKFIRSALAFSCLSVIPLAGCSNSSSRNFSLGLREEAAKSALLAEEQLAEQKARAAEAKAEAKSDAEQASQDKRKSPLLSFLRGDSKPSGDPFLDSKNEAIAAADNSATKPPAAESQPKDTAAWSDEGVLQVNGTRPESPKTDSSWDSVMKDYLAEGAKAERPAWEQAVSSQPDTEIPSLTERYLDEQKPADEKSEFAWVRGESAGPESRTVGPTPPADWAKSSFEQPAKETASNPWATQSPVASKEQPPVASNTDAHRVPVARVVNEAQATKLRIQSLLSQAHSDLLRGDAYSAYRSALLAQQETDKHKVTFAAGEERPSELVNTISQRLWGSELASAPKSTPKESFAAAPFSTAPKAPAAATPDWGHAPTAGGRVASQNAIFDDVRQSEWIAVPEGPPNMPRMQPQTSPAGLAFPAPAASSPLAADPDANRLPDIRANESHQIRRMSASADDQAAGIARLAFIEEEQPLAEQPLTTGTDPWKTFQHDARQQLGQPAAAPIARAPQPRSLSAPSWTEWSTIGSEPPAKDAPQDGWRSALAQAPAPPAESAVLPLHTVKTAPVVAASHQSGQVTARTGSGNSKWAIFGFIAALAATVVGLRARRETA